MAERPDPESQTEEPTERKILDELEKGNLPISREASAFAAAFAMVVIVAFLARNLLKSLGTALSELLIDPAGLRLETGGDAVLLLSDLAWQVSVPLIPVLTILIVAGIGASFLQHAPRFVPDRVKPDWHRISPANGWRRMFSIAGQVDLLKNAFKLCSFGLVIWFALKWQGNALFESMALDPNAVPDLILAMGMRLLTALCFTTFLLLAIDLLWVRIHWRKDIRMTRQEVKDEIKEAEGDPLRKARLRSLALDRRRKAMIAAVPKATLVIANPTHYAVALRYIREEGGAPIVVSKGMDFIALKIREVAEQHSIPIIEDRLLARSMYDAVHVDHAIPPQFYKAVAEIIHMIYAKKLRKAAVK